MDAKRWCRKLVCLAKTASAGAALTIASGLLLSGCGGGGFGCGEFGVGPCGPTPMPTDTNWGVAVADFNHDGYPDVVVNHSISSTQIGYDAFYMHDAASGAGFQPPLQLTDSKAWSSLTAVDLDGDGLPDLVSLNNWNYQVSVFLNDPQHPGNFGPSTVLDTKTANQVVVADMNGDGVPDLLVADNHVSLYMQNPAARGTFAAAVALYPSGAGYVAAGDLNGDGLMDVALADSEGVKILFRTGTASELNFAAPVTVWTRTPNPNYGGAVNQIQIADLTGHGLSDLVITDPGPPGGTQLLVILLQDPANRGQFLPAVTYPLPNFTGLNFVVADLLGNGLPDLVFGGILTVSVFLQDPANPGTFQSPNNYSVPISATFVAVADIDGDGRPDIVTSDGVTYHEVNGVATDSPGLMLQDPAQPGHFKAVQDLQ